MQTSLCFLPTFFFSTPYGLFLHRPLFQFNLLSSIFIFSGWNVSSSLPLSIYLCLTAIYQPHIFVNNLWTQTSLSFYFVALSTLFSSCFFSFNTSRTLCPFPAHFFLWVNYCSFFIGLSHISPAFVKLIFLFCWWMQASISFLSPCSPDPFLPLWDWFFSLSSWMCAYFISILFPFNTMQCICNLIYHFLSFWGRLMWLLMVHNYQKFSSRMIQSSVALTTHSIYVINATFTVCCSFTR